MFLRFFFCDQHMFFKGLSEYKLPAFSDKPVHTCAVVYEK